MQVQIRLLTRESKYSVPDTELSVPATITPEGINNLIRGLLSESGSEDEEIPNFSLLCLNDVLGVSLEEFLSDRIFSPESVLEINYFSKNPDPSPLSSSNHDDWVSGVSARGDLVLTSSYDGRISLWDATKETMVNGVPGHAPSPAKSVVWVSLNSSLGLFASSSHDQTVLLYEYLPLTNEISRVNVLKGHERSVDCLAVSSKHLASGSFDNNVKLWSFEVTDPGEASEESSTSASKRMRFAATKSPISTLSGHKEGVSSLAFPSVDTLYSASWDHTIKIWDLEISGMKGELVGNKSFFDISHKENQILAASADRFVRIYDARSNETSIVRSTYSSHQGWVTSVSWCQERENLFVSGSHDKILKMWDSRSYKTPLYDLTGHSERILCCDWSNKDYIVSGGADNDMKIFKSNVK